jgi:hypothetical protein
MRKFVFVIFAASLFVTIADLGAVAQAAYPGRPIWALVVLGQICLAVVVYRFW